MKSIFTVLILAITICARSQTQDLNDTAHLQMQAVLLKERILALQLQRQPLKFVDAVQKIPTTNCPADFQGAWRSHVADIIHQEHINSLSGARMAILSVLAFSIPEMEIMGMKQDMKAINQTTALGNVWSHDLQTVLLKYGYHLSP